MEHLGRLPSELGLNDAQVKELLAYHRIQRRSQDVCPECIKESRDREKKCFVCSRKYTEEHGVIHERGDRGSVRPEDGNNAIILGMLRDKHEPKLKDASEEEKEKKKQEWVKWAKANGIKILDAK